MHQLRGGITFSYDLYFNQFRGLWKGITEDPNIEKAYKIPLAMVYHKN